METFIIILLFLNLLIIPALLYFIYLKIDEMHHFMKIMIEKEKNK